jgi:multicomponent Na+:H+ antiporter subunit G
MVRAIAVDLLLGLAVLIALASATGILIMPDAFSKLHYLSPLSIVTPLLVGLAVLVNSGWSTSSAQTWLALLFVVIASPVLSHATIRAARIRSEGDWRPGHGRRGPAGVQADATERDVTS